MTAHKMPFGAKADYFQVAFEDGSHCGHPHRTIESAARCLNETREAVTVVAIWKRKDAIGTARLYHKDFEHLSERQVQALLEWRQQDSLP